MAGFEGYRDDFTVDYFNRFLPAYLLNEGTTLHGEMKLYWDLMNNTREKWIQNIMMPLDIGKLLAEYLKWVHDEGDPVVYLDPSYTHEQDKQFQHYNLIIKICSLYGITRVHEVGALSLAHMLRLLIFKTGMRLFDGSKRRLMEIYDNISLGEAMRFRIQTETGDDIGVAGTSATCKYRLLRGVLASTVEFNSTDDALFNGGYYNIEILGIVYNYDIVGTNALIYDNASMKYDDDKEYDGGSAA